MGRSKHWNKPGSEKKKWEKKKKHRGDTGRSHNNERYKRLKRKDDLLKEES